MTKAVSVLFIISIIYTSSLREETLGEVEFARGNSAFTHGDYTTALSAYLSAKAKGITSPRLYYNLGVTYYKLDYFARSFNAFVIAVEDPELASLAFLNMGFAATKLQRQSDAIQAFKNAVDTAITEIQRQRAIRTLDNVGIIYRGASHPMLNKTWNSQLSAYFGHDSNVTLVDDASLSTSNDPADQFFLFSGSLSNSIRPWLRTAASLHSINYRDKLYASYSPARYGVETVVTLRPFPIWLIILGGKLFFSRYQDENSLPDASVRKREDTKYFLNAKLARSLKQHLWVFGEIGMTDNNSNIAQFTYTNTRLLAGITWQY